MLGRRKYLIVTGDSHDDGFRRSAMRERMMNGQFRGSGGNYRNHPAYDEGYKRGYSHAWKDHERMMNGDMSEFNDED